MALSVNKVILVGNLGKDPELRSTPQGKSVCSFSIATTDRYLDKATNDWKDNTEWHNVVAWERLADAVAQKLKKGSNRFPSTLFFSIDIEPINLDGHWHFHEQNLRVGKRVNLKFIL